jgi:hypothetical protein
MRSRRDAGGYRTIFDIDRTMNIENRSRMRDFVLRDAKRDHNAAALNRLTVAFGHRKGREPRPPFTLHASAIGLRLRRWQ